MSKDFLQWVVNELRLRAWRNADLARAGEMSESMVSRVLNGGSKVTWDFCNGVALAFKTRPEPLYRHAGLTPPLPPAVTEETEIVGLIRKLPEQERLIILRALRGLASDATRHKLPATPARTLHTQGKEEALGELAYDENEIAVRKLDDMATVLSPEVLRFAAALLLKRAEEKQTSQDQDVDDDQQDTLGGSSNRKTERVSAGEAGAAISDEN